MINRFSDRLSEAACWCASKLDSADAANALRSPELAPSGEGGWDAIVASVCERRARLLKRQPPYPLRLPSGSLLIFDADQTLGDGAAMVESGGFFDFDNTPPWDTWVGYLREEPIRPGSWTRLDSYLLCWIPAEFVSLVQRAIDVNPEECLLWADRVDTTFLRHWRPAALIAR